jgi:hypothetical protein
VQWQPEQQSSASGIHVARDTGKAPAKVHQAATRASKKARIEVERIKAKRRRAAA